MPAPKRYPDELKERSVRLVFESGRPIAHVASDLGIKYESLRQWVRQAEADAGDRADRLTSTERQRLGQLEREVKDLRRANEILKAASAFSPRSSTRPERGEHVRRRTSRALRGRVHLRDLGVSASAYYERRSGRRSDRAIEDERLLEVIKTTHAKNYSAYGYRRTWKALLRAGERVPRCRVQRLMRTAGIDGAKRRGKPWARGAS